MYERDLRNGKNLNNQTLWYKRPVYVDSAYPAVDTRGTEMFFMFVILNGINNINIIFKFKGLYITSIQF